MDTQLALTFDAVPVVPPKRRLSIDERFRVWAERNPQVVAAFCDIAERMVSEGKDWVSARDIFGDMRRDRELLSLGDEYKINNDYAAPMARLAEQLRPALAGKFEFRVRTSQR